MGYRHYLGVIETEKLDKISTDANLDNWQRFDKITENVEKSICLGKLYFGCDDIIKVLYDNIVHLLDDETDFECFICDKDVFVKLANVYRKKVEDYYKKKYEAIKNIPINNLDKITEDERKALLEIIMDVRDKVNWLEGTKFEKGSMYLTDLLEHEMFNYMHLQETVDFSKYSIVCFAY